MTALMKKVISLLLLLCLLCGVLPAGAEGSVETETTAAAETSSETAEATETAASDEPEERGVEPAAGYDFDFILRLHPEALSADLAERAAGYASLLEALRFHGSYIWSTVEPGFDFNLSIIPVDSRGDPISIRIHGAEDLMYVNSSLMGDKTVSLRTFSLLNFCSKMSEHLGLPLHYAALLVPYVWASSLELPIQDWNGMVEKMDENGVIPTDAVKYLWDCWWYRSWADEAVKILVDALCKDSDLEESFRAMVEEIPDYFVHQVAQDQEIRVIKEGDRTVWRAVTGDFFTTVESDRVHAYNLSLPAMKTGYLPVFSLQGTEENSKLYGNLRLQLLGTNSLQEDLVNLQASFLAVPTVWPANSQSLISLSLTGGLLQNIGLSVYMATEENGYLHMDVRKPTVDYEPGPVMLTVEGYMNPKGPDTTILEFDLADGDGSLDLLVANDSTIRNFLPDLVQPMLEGMLRFLVGIPTNSCQTLMDDLTDLGVINLLLGE